MIDIRLETTFFRHPKTIKLQRRLGWEGVISLIKLWFWARENRPEGYLQGDAIDIEIAAEWRGEEGVFCSSLLDVCFLEKEGDRLYLRNWAQRNPWAAGATERSLKAKKGGCAKYGKKCETCKEDCPNSATFYHKQILAPTPSPSPSPSPKKTIVAEALRLATLLADLILTEMPNYRELSQKKRTATEERWAIDIEKLNRLDNKTWEEIEDVIRWAQADLFWRANILSGKKLREKYDRLCIAMKKPQRGEYL